MSPAARLWLAQLGNPLCPPMALFDVRARLLRACGVEIGKGARIMSTARIIGNAHVTIGDDAFISHEVLILGGRSTISIGAGAGIGPRSIIINGKHDMDLSVYPRGREGSEPIVIGDRASIYSGVTVTGGVTIGEGAVVGANSVVIRDIPAYAFAVGSPCRVVKMWDPATRQWSRV